jgi:3-oxoacyl-[acyl-carrier protein] reductase
LYSVTILVTIKIIRDQNSNQEYLKMSRLTGKVAIVTGASKGIGAGIARALASAGASVVVNYSSSREGAEKVVAEIIKKDGKAIAIQGDVSKSSDVKKLFEETKNAFGTLDILVNNAGIFKFEPLEAFTEAEFYRQFNTNVLGPLLTAQESLKYFGSKGGNIINIGSIAGSSPPPNAVIYASTKGALNTVTRALASELGPRNIRVNSINPGGVDTEGARSLGIIGSDFEKAMVAGTPLGRLGQPDDIGKVVALIASDDSGWVTGETISVGGGAR